MGLNCGPWVPGLDDAPCFALLLLLLLLESLGCPSPHPCSTVRFHRFACHIARGWGSCSRTALHIVLSCRGGRHCVAYSCIKGLHSVLGSMWLQQHVCVFMWYISLCSIQLTQCGCGAAVPSHLRHCCPVSNLLFSVSLKSLALQTC